MVQNPDIDPSPFYLEGGPVGVLLIHGFTGSPPEMRLLGDYLHQCGLTVSGPLLPGHGTALEDLNRVRWIDWTEHVEAALSELQTRCRTVFVGGLSMGALLTLYLAANHPDLPGAMAYAPATLVADWRIGLVPLLKYLVRQMPKDEDDDLHDPNARSRIWSYDGWPASGVHELNKLTRQVKRLLPQVTCPLLLVCSTGDRTVHPDSGRFTYARVGSTDKELVTLHGCGHVLTVDAEWETVAEKTHQFIQSHMG
ncbi:MAG: alpha/beta fold hydrolase [Anaerolineae bacterium]